jgi:hypothetical protein
MEDKKVTSAKQHKGDQHRLSETTQPKTTGSSAQDGQHDSDDSKNKNGPSSKIGFWHQPEHWIASFACVSAIATCFTGYFIFEQLQTSRLDQRAWVSPTFQDFSIVQDKQISMPTRFADTGKTPAKHVSVSVKIELIGSHSDPDFLYIPGHSYMLMGAGSLLPNDPGQLIIIQAFRHGQSSIEPMIATPSVIDDLHARRLVLFIHGRVIYDDIFGASHWLTFCRQNSGTDISANARCSAYNGTDDQ